MVRGSRGVEGGGAFVIIIGHRLTVTGYKQSQLRQQCENWAKSNKTQNNPAMFCHQAYEEAAGSSPVAERGDSGCMVLTHDPRVAPRTAITKQSAGSSISSHFLPRSCPTLPAPTFSGSLVSCCTWAACSHWMGSLSPFLPLNQPLGS